MDASQVLLPRKCIKTHAGNMCSHAGMHTHAGACAHMRQLQTHRAETNTCALFYMYTLHTCTKHGRQSRPPTRDQRHPHRKPTRLEPHWPAQRRPRCIAPSGDAPVAAGQGAHCREMRKRDAVWTSCTVLPDIASLFNGNRAVSLSDRQRPPLCLAIRFDVDNIDVVRTRLPTESWRASLQNRHNNKTKSTGTISTIALAASCDQPDFA